MTRGSGSLVGNHTILAASCLKASLVPIRRTPSAYIIYSLCRTIQPGISDEAYMLRRTGSDEAVVKLYSSRSHPFRSTKHNRPNTHTQGTTTNTIIPRT